jgi:hypothetical protein
MEQTWTVCASVCKSQYGLTENDLARIHVRYVRNPYGYNQPPMRLYEMTDVENLMHVVLCERKVARDHAYLRAEYVRSKKIADEKLYQERSTAFLERYDVQEISTPVTSDFGLPTDVLNIIMERVVIGGRSEGVTRDVLAQNLCVLASVSKEFRRAVKSGFDKLQDDIPRIDIDMMQVLRAPSEMTLESLKTVARYLCVPVSGRKNSLILRILRSLNIRTPTVPYAYDTPYALVAINQYRNG